MVNRKNAEQIQEDILSHLKEGPKSIKKLSELTKSTWATINTHLNNLKEEVQSYINSYFTTDPPSCTGYVNKNDTSYVFLFRKDI